jgi:hypothetical protein
MVLLTAPAPFAGNTDAQITRAIALRRTVRRITAFLLSLPHSIHPSFSCMNSRPEKMPDFSPLHFKIKITRPHIIKKVNMKAGIKMVPKT